MKNKILSLCVFILLVHNAFSQSKPSGKHFILNVDYNRFWKNDTTAFVEISTGLYPSLAAMQTDDSGIHGKADVFIMITRNTDGQIVFNNRYAVVLSYPDSQALARARMVVNNTTYELERNIYRVDVRCMDVNDAAKSDSSSFQIEIGSKPQKESVSDIELCSEIVPSTDLKNSFYKNSYQVIPNPSCTFGASYMPVLFSYVELYNLSAPELYTFTASLMNSSQKSVKSRQRKRNVASRNIVDVFKMSIGSFVSGKYLLEYSVSDSTGKVLASNSRPVFLYNPQVKILDTARIYEGIPEYRTMSIEELRDEFRIMKFLVQPEETQIFSKLKSADACRRYLENLWFNIEQNTAGKQAYTRRMLQERVAVVNERFYTSSKKGWQTDRGRVYIRYGKPDETQRYPNMQDKKSYEIWSYRQLENGVEFVFIDQTGFNDYFLVHSTKRGEILNESWQDLLKRKDPFDTSDER
ncbi:MAG: GWxTD domain-containing protein [Bacteroidetes bacterium]|nr:GWxTD domain-containing protein [Bacteroidota bacterium]